jgi:hypothetical protein
MGMDRKKKLTAGESKGSEGMRCDGKKGVGRCDARECQSEREQKEEIDASKGG